MTKHPAKYTSRGTSQVVVVVVVIAVVLVIRQVDRVDITRMLAEAVVVDVLFGRVGRVDISAGSTRHDERV